MQKTSRKQRQSAYKSAKSAEEQWLKGFTGESVSFLEKFCVIIFVLGKIKALYCELLIYSSQCKLSVHFINHLISSGISPFYTFQIDYIIIKQKLIINCLTYSQTKLVNIIALYYLNLFISQYLMKVTFCFCLVALKSCLTVFHFKDTVRTKEFGFFHGSLLLICLEDECNQFFLYEVNICFYRM